MTDETAEAPTLVDVTAIDASYVATWYKIHAEASRLKAVEAMMRRRIFDHYFPKPKEGSKDNKHPMGDGTGAILQADYKIARKVLEPELKVLLAEQHKAHFGEDGTPLQSNVPKLPINRLVKYTPELVKAEYNKLTEEERKLFDTVLEIKPGMPEVKVVIPKRG